MLASSTVPEVLGWRFPTVLLLGVDDDGAYQLVETPVDGSAPHTVSRIGHGVGDLAWVSGMELATRLIADAEIRGGGAERGPWPGWWRMSLAAATMIVAGVAWLIHRRRRKVQPVAPEPGGSAPRLQTT